MFFPVVFRIQSEATAGHPVSVLSWSVAPLSEQLLQLLDLLFHIADDLRY